MLTAVRHRVFFLGVVGKFQGVVFPSPFT
jgi:hypothetical protein